MNEKEKFQNGVHIYLKSLLFTLKKEELIRYEELTLKQLIAISHCYEYPDRVIPTQKKNPYIVIPNRKEEEKFEGFSRYKHVLNGLKGSSDKISNEENQLIFLLKLTNASIKLLNSPKFQFFSANQKHVYVYLMKHLLKEMLYELPLQLRREFVQLFNLRKSSEIRKSPFFQNIISVLLEIGNYEIIDEEIQEKNFEFIAEYFTFFLKAFKKGFVSYPPNFDQLFEENIQNWLVKEEEIKENPKSTTNYLKKVIFIKSSSCGYVIFAFSKLLNRRKFKEIYILDTENISDFFTIYNIREEYGKQHWYNYKVYSLLSVWLQQIYERKANKSSEPLTIREEHGVIFTGISVKTKEIIISYCLRLFTQSERKIDIYKTMKKKKIIIDLHKEYNEAVICEALKIMNLLCKIDSNLIPKILNYILNTYERIVKNQSGLSFIDLLQFLLDHEINILVDFEKPFKEFFNIHLSNNYNNAILAIKTLDFLFQNREELYLKTRIFLEAYPTIFKLLIWFPLQLKSSFLKIMTYFINKDVIINDSVDLFHFLIDLPMMTALLEIVDPFWDVCYGNPVLLLDPEYHDIVKYFFRLDGKQKEILFLNKEKSKNIDLLFDSFSPTSRIVAVCEICPELLSKYLDLFIEKMPSENIIILAVDIFFRFSKIYNSEEYKLKLRRILLKNIELHERILERISNFEELENRDLVKHPLKHAPALAQVLTLCWALGEYIQNDLSFVEFEGSYSSSEIANKYCDALEIIIYEIIKEAIHRKKRGDVEIWDLNDSYLLFITKLTQIIVNSLLKIAIKFKEYIPKVTLIFSKLLSHKEFFLKHVISKVEENLALLHYTGVASVLFIGNDICMKKV